MRASERLVRSNTLRPTISSRRLTWTLTADWVRATNSAAAVKLPVSAIAAKLRNRSMSRLAACMIDEYPE